MKVRKAAEESGGGGPGRNGAPRDGWIRTMRHARGVSLRQLGKRIGIQGNSVHVAERREMEGGISIYQLRRMAAALDCDLFYAFVPRQKSLRPSQRYAAALHARQSAEQTGLLKADVDFATARPEDYVGRATTLDLRTSRGQLPKGLV